MQNAKLLLVEDDAALAELLSWNFKKEEYDVLHTPDGEEALLLVRENRPDVILLDWMIENLSGIE
ncbi:MAG: response regulator, partial [Pseudomonadota bacterium]